MDFDFSDDQQSLRDAVRRWVEKGYGFERRKGIVAAGGFDRAAYGELAELGLTALTVPEAQGGLGQGAVDAMVAMEELGRGIVLEPLAQTFMARLYPSNAEAAAFGMIGAAFGVGFQRTGSSADPHLTVHIDPASGITQSKSALVRFNDPDVAGHPILDQNPVMRAYWGIPA